MKHYENDRRVWSIMMEVWRGPYVDERPVDKVAVFAKTHLIMEKY